MCTKITASTLNADTYLYYNKYQQQTTVSLSLSLQDSMMHAAMHQHQDEASSSLPPQSP